MKKISRGNEKQQKDLETLKNQIKSLNLKKDSTAASPTPTKTPTTQTASNLTQSPANSNIEELKENSSCAKKSTIPSPMNEYLEANKAKDYPKIDSPSKANLAEEDQINESANNNLQQPETHIQQPETPIQPTLETDFLRLWQLPFEELTILVENARRKKDESTED